MSSGVSGLKSRNCIPKGVLWAGGDMARDEFLLHYMATPTQSFSKDTEKNKFAKFLVMKHKDENRKLSKENPFMIDKALKEILGKKSHYEMKPLSSGLLLKRITSFDTSAKNTSIERCKNSNLFFKNL